MYAVIETGGKQYRVEVGTELEVELLDVEPGQPVTLERVLLVGDGEDTAVGRPLVANAAVEAEVLRRDRGEKLIVFKYRPKARSRVKKGHRQNHTVLRITDVKLGDKSAAALVRKHEQEVKTERQRLEEAAARQAAEDAALAAKLSKREGAAKATTVGRTKAGTKGAGSKATTGKTAVGKAAGATTSGKSAPSKAAAKPATRTAKASSAGPGANAAKTIPSKGTPKASDVTADEKTTGGSAPRRRTKKDEEA